MDFVLVCIIITGLVKNINNDYYHYYYYYYYYCANTIAIMPTTETAQ